MVPVSDRHALLVHSRDDCLIKSMVKMNASVEGPTCRLVEKPSVPVRSRYHVLLLIWQKTRRDWRRMTERQNGISVALADGRAFG